MITLHPDVVALARTGAPITPAATTRSAGRTLTTDLPTTDPAVFVKIMTFRIDTTKVYRTVAIAERVKGAFRQSFPIEGSIGVATTAATPRYSAAHLRDSHHAHGAFVAKTVAANPAVFDAILTTTQEA